MDLETKQITIMMPFRMIAQMVHSYLLQTGGLDPEAKVASFYLPIDVNEEELVEIKVGILQEPQETLN